MFDCLTIPASKNPAIPLFCRGMKSIAPRLFPGLLLALIMSSCSDVKEPVFQDVENLKLGTLGLDKATLSANIRFDNPNRFGLQLKQIDCEVYVDSTYLGHFANTSSVNIPARQAFLLPVQGEVQTIKLMEYSRKALMQEPSAVRVEGKARVGRSGLYKTIPFIYRDTILLKF